MKSKVKEMIEMLKIPKLYSTEEQEDKVAYIRFYDLHSCWEWIVYEAEVQFNDEVLFFGLVKGFESELGYFTINELINLNQHSPRILIDEDYYNEMKKLV